MEIDYSDIDVEIRELVKVLNSLEGIETTCSCFGHGKDITTIYFKAKDWISLHNLLFNHFNTVNTWYIKLDNSDVNRDVNSPIRCVLCSYSNNPEVLNEQIPILCNNFKEN